MISEHGNRFDVAVVGGGATGLAAALVAAVAGPRTLVFAPPAPAPPARTAALLQGSLNLLTELDVWPALIRHAAPLKAIRIVDATRRLIRAPETVFHASEIGLPAFGFNVPNADLVAALRRHAEAFANLRLESAPVEEIVPEDGSVRLRTGDQTFSARLVVGADGMRSQARDAAGIAVRRWDYRQAALVATFALEQPHRGVSTEFHTESGPFTLVPLPGDRASLVWVDRPDRLEVVAMLDEVALSRAASEKAQFIHGAMRLDGPPAVFPLKAALADRFAARRIVLVGETAHLFPPIGAQGLNLGFRDVMQLRRILSRYSADPGAPEALEAYHSARRGDVRTRTLAVDALNRSLLTDFLPMQAARGLSLALASSIPLLRKTLMRRDSAAHRALHAGYERARSAQPNR